MFDRRLSQWGGRKNACLPPPPPPSYLVGSVTSLVCCMYSLNSWTSVHSHPCSRVTFYLPPVYHTYLYFPTRLHHSPHHGVPRTRRAPHTTALQHLACTTPTVRGVPATFENTTGRSYYLILYTTANITTIFLRYTPCHTPHTLPTPALPSYLPGVSLDVARYAAGHTLDWTTCCRTHAPSITTPTTHTPPTHTYHLYTCPACHIPC